MKLLPFSKRKIKGLMLQLFLQLLTIVAVMVAFLLIINSTFIETVYYLRSLKSMSNVVQEVDAIESTDSTFLDEMKNIENKGTLYIEIFKDSSDKLVYSTVMNELIENTIYEKEEGPQIFASMMKAKDISIKSKLYTNDAGVFYIGKEDAIEMEYFICQSRLSTGETIKIYTQRNVIESNADYTSDIISTVINVSGLTLMIAFFIYAWLFTKPLIEMNDVTKRMSKMDFSQKCVTKSTNELGQLASNINSMSDSLAQAMGDLQEKNRQLELDIEHEHKMEKSRKEFVSNVSHELKTPIAIIQGYAEGLKLGVGDNPADKEEYLDVIIEESKKMNDIVLDLLELSYYESGSYKLNESRFSLNNLIEDYAQSHKMLLAEKGIELEVLIPDDMVGFADEAKTGMVLNNYISNAVSHCEGEKKIIVTAREINDLYRISVFNTGKNISDDVVEEMWLSFYRGDKARNRKDGRFGIGLSLVAAIQDMHGMAYGCENKENGVEFWFEVKKHVKDLTI